MPGSHPIAAAPIGIAGDIDVSAVTGIANAVASSIGVGRAVSGTTAAATGAASVSGAGAATTSAVAVAAGFALAAGIAVAVVTSAGVSSGSSAATAASAATKQATGGVAASATVSGVSGAVKSTAWAASGAASTSGAAGANFNAQGFAAGVSAAEAVSAAIKSAQALASGLATPLAISNAPPPIRVSRVGERTIAIEITAAINPAGEGRTFYLSDARLVTQPTDTPSNTSFDETLLDPGSIAMTAFGDGRTGGGTRLALGEIRLANLDGQYDGWLDYGFDGRRVVIRRGSGGAYPGDFGSVFSGTVEALTVNRAEVVIRLRDKQLIFDRPALTTTYAGSNELPNGIEGTANDIKGQPKPRLFGVVKNIAPPCVNTSKLVYQISDGGVASVEAVYDRGDAIPFDNDYGDVASLLAAIPPAGSYATCLSRGLVRLGSSPTGLVTVDATQGSNPSDRTAAQILRQLAILAGVSGDSISGADIAALDDANPSVIGIWLSAQDTFAKAMDMVAGSVGAYYGFDQTEVLRVARLEAPAGSAVLALQEEDILDRIERRPARDGDLPAWSMTVRYGRIWTVQGQDIAGSVNPDRRAELATEYRAVRVEDASVKSQFLLASEDAVDTLLINAAEAEAEAVRRLELHKVRRNFFDVTVPADLFIESGAVLMDVVSLTSTRFGLSEGRLFRLLGFRPELARGRVTLTLWG